MGHTNRNAVFAKNILQWLAETNKDMMCSVCALSETNWQQLKTVRIQNSMSETVSIWVAPGNNMLSMLGTEYRHWCENLHKDR